jgi:ATP-dependent RNA/DNA helicase IGHMBP2
LLHLEPLPPRTSRRDLIDFLTSATGINARQIGRIDLRGQAATVELPEHWAARIVKALDGMSWKGRKIRAWTTSPLQSTGQDHFQRLARLLELESAAEAQELRERSQRRPAAEAERTGNALVDLVIVDESSGLGGRCILTLAKRNRSLALPWTRLQAGAPVLLAPQDAAATASWRGVLCDRSERSVRIALDEPPEDVGETCRIDLCADEVTRLRQQAALERARTARRDRLAELRQVLLGATPPAFGPEQELVPLDATLDPSQQEAVRFALAAQDLAIIHGPPGTGKTTAVIELIRQAVRRGEKVLACAPSNLAVDNLVERLAAAGERVVRLGHPARVLPTLHAHTLDVLAQEHDDVKLARKFTKEAFALFRKARKWTRAQPEPGARREQRQEGRELLAEARRLEAQAVERILDSAAVLCSTTTALDSELLGQRQFHLAVLDEACQTTEPGCWVPLLRCARLVLAGDHCQLPPTVRAPAAAAEGFGISLLERLVAHYGPTVTRRLRVQYRMHELIMRFSSEEFYDAELEAAPSVAGHLLCDLPGVRPDELTEAPVQFLDTAGAGFDEQLEPEGESRLNPQEARLVARKVRALLDLGVPAADMAVIAPYAAQVRLLREELPIAGLEIDSVDGFQGREKEAVLVSLVRSNTANDIGFLADVRRMNVALTRARRKLLVIGDSATLAVHPFYQKLFAYFEAVGAHRSVWEEEEF